MFEAIQKYIQRNALEFEEISVERKKKLHELSKYISDLITADKPVNLIFICTHNSRRSQMSMLWALLASKYYSIPDINCYSGGTEATAFNPRAVKAMERAGFVIQNTDESENPIYLLSYSNELDPVRVFSKLFTDDFNPQDEFAAIMTCAEADEACPFIPGADERIPIQYEDPKKEDDTPQEKASYDMRCRLIAKEMFFVFSNIKAKLNQN